MALRIETGKQAEERVLAALPGDVSVPPPPPPTPLEHPTSASVWLPLVYFGPRYPESDYLRYAPGPAASTSAATSAAATTATVPSASTARVEIAPWVTAFIGAPAAPPAAGVVSAAETPFISATSGQNLTTLWKNHTLWNRWVLKEVQDARPKRRAKTVRVTKNKKKFPPKFDPDAEDAHEEAEAEPTTAASPSASATATATTAAATTATASGQTSLAPLLSSKVDKQRKITRVTPEAKFLASQPLTIDMLKPPFVALFHTLRERDTKEWKTESTNRVPPKSFKVFVNLPALEYAARWDQSSIPDYLFDLLDQSTVGWVSYTTRLITTNEEVASRNRDTVIVDTRNRESYMKDVVVARMQQIEDRMQEGKSFPLSLESSHWIHLRLPAGSTEPATTGVWFNSFLRRMQADPPNLDQTMDRKRFAFRATAGLLRIDDPADFAALLLALYPLPEAASSDTATRGTEQQLTYPLESRATLVIVNCGTYAFHLPFLIRQGAAVDTCRLQQRCAWINTVSDWSSLTYARVLTLDYIFITPLVWLNLCRDESDTLYALGCGTFLTEVMGGSTRYREREDCIARKLFLSRFTTPPSSLDTSTAATSAAASISISTSTAASISISTSTAASISISTSTAASIATASAAAVTAAKTAGSTSVLSSNLARQTSPLLAHFKFRRVCVEENHADTATHFNVNTASRWILIVPKIAPPTTSKNYRRESNSDRDVVDMLLSYFIDPATSYQTEKERTVFPAGFSRSLVSKAVVDHLWIDVSSHRNDPTLRGRRPPPDIQRQMETLTALRTQPQATLLIPPCSRRILGRLSDHEYGGLLASQRTKYDRLKREAEVQDKIEDARKEETRNAIERLNTRHHRPIASASADTAQTAAAPSASTAAAAAAAASLLP